MTWFQEYIRPLPSDRPYLGRPIICQALAPAPISRPTENSNRALTPTLGPEKPDAPHGPSCLQTRPDPAMGITLPGVAILDSDSGGPGMQSSPGQPRTPMGLKATSRQWRE